MFHFEIEVLRAFLILIVCLCRLELRIVIAEVVAGETTATTASSRGGTDLLFASTTCSTKSEGEGWIPKDDHPCTIHRMGMEEFNRKFAVKGGLPPLFPHPIVVADAPKQRNEHFRSLTRRDVILLNFPTNFTVTLSSSNSYSEHRRTIPFAQYLDEVSSTRMTPNQRSNETWYLFGETYSTEWKQLLRHYMLPPCQACRRDEHDTLVALSFGIGNSGSGVSWHVHGPGFSEAIHGRKHWILRKEQPNFHPDQTSYNWMHENYSPGSTDPGFLECTLFPGDMVYFPDMWWHATINIDDYTAFVSTFTQEHLLPMKTTAIH